MNTSSHDFVTVDMRGLKAALVTRAQAQRVTVSVLVRRAVARELGLLSADKPEQAALPTVAVSTATSVKLSIRMTPIEAHRLAAGARAAGLSRGAYLAGLISNVPILVTGASRLDHIAALIASSAELSTLSRNIHHLTALLRQGAFRAAQEYQPMLDSLGTDVRAHLVLSSRALADLQPRGRQLNAAVSKNKK